MKSIILSFLLAYSSIHLVPHDLALQHEGKLITMVTRDHYALPFANGPFIDEGKLQFLLDNIEKKIYKEPTNATLNENGEIIPEKPGYKPDREKFRVLFRNFFYNGEPAELEIPTKRVYPRVDSELLVEIKEKKIGSYVTYFKSSNKERTNNIELASAAINNYVLFPGETFSFNKVVGKRTKEKGYKKAPVIVKGELAEDIGGGICQVSSTLFNAVDQAGMEIVERYSHSRSVPYVPKGRDATVSWYGPDFAFKNEFNQPVLIRARAESGQMQITIYTSESAKTES